MSDVVPASSTEVATAAPAPIVEGLEDFDTADQVMPTLKIDHDSGQLVDGLSGQSYDEIEVILLGLIKQRVLWPAEMGSGEDPPMCKSYNYTEGHPDARTFPAAASGLAVEWPEGVVLPCESCALKDWGSHPTRDIPWCTEQHTLPLLMQVNPEDPFSLAPAIFTIQRSGIKPSKTYLTAFARERKPLFTVKTKISLDQRKRGSVDFAVPKFVRGEATDPAVHEFCADQYRMIRDFVQTPRAEEAEPAAASAPAASAPAADDDDELF